MQLRMSKGEGEIEYHKEIMKNTAKFVSLENNFCKNTKQAPLCSLNLFTCSRFLIKSIIL